MRRVGRVIAVHASDGQAPARVTVALDPAAACSRCAAGRGCGAASFLPATNEALLIECRTAGRVAGPGAGVDAASDAAAIVVGSVVEVEPDDGDSRWLLPVVLAYGLPTIGLLAGACVPEPWTPFTALAGLGGGLLAWRRFDAASGMPGRPATARPRAGPYRPAVRIPQERASRIPSGESA